MAMAPLQGIWCLWREFTSISTLNDLVHLLQPRSLRVLTWCKHSPGLAQVSLLGLDHRSESWSNPTENDYRRNLKPYSQRIQQIVKCIRYMGGKWARSWSPRFDFRFFVWRWCQLYEFGLLFAHCLVQYESCLLQVYMLCEIQRNWSYNDMIK